MKLFSTSNFAIPTILKIITTKAVVKIVLVFFWATWLKNDVIFDFFWSFKFLFYLLKIFKVAGSRVKVTVKETNRPTVIIHPKSIIGLIPLNISDRKAHIVVSTV